MLFYKPISTLAGPEDAIVVPRVARDEGTDFEVEIGVLIAKDCRDVGVEQAMEYVLGYCTVNDVSSRMVWPGWREVSDATNSLCTTPRGWSAPAGFITPASSQGATVGDRQRVRQSVKSTQLIHVKPLPLTRRLVSSRFQPGPRLAQRWFPPRRSGTPTSSR